jgi:hypothetical protein
MTRRDGFFSAHALFWIILCTLVVGIVTERTTHIVSSWRDVSPDIAQSELASAAIEAAENWLFRSFEMGYAPRANNVHASSPLQKIEAVFVNGESFDPEAYFPGLDVDIFIADTSFDAATLPPGALLFAVPSIPHEPPDTENGNRGVYRYFIRSSAGSEARNYRAVREELLRFEVDGTFGTPPDARRVFSRSETVPR